MVARPIGSLSRVDKDRFVEISGVTGTMVLTGATHAR